MNILINKKDLSKLRQALFLACLAGLFCFTNASAQSNSWPKITLPEKTQSFPVGSEMTVNGMPMRVQGFISILKPGQLVKWFRQSLGEPLVETPNGNKLVLGRAQGDYYLTIQLEPTANSTHGFVAVTNLKATADNLDQSRQSLDRWTNRMPSGSSVMNQISSEDNGKISNQLVMSNFHSESLNAERIKTLMRGDGFEFEREELADKQAVAKIPISTVRGKVLFFKGNNKEAMAVISRSADGRTAILLNTLAKVERLK